MKDNLEEGAPDWLRDGFYEDYPNTPRFIYGGENERLIYDRNHGGEEAERKGSGPSTSRSDLFNQSQEQINP